MRHRPAPAAPRHGAPPGQEGGLIQARYVGSYPDAGFTLPTALPELAVLGRSNVGKSSLINAFLGRRSLARTSGSPGKTQACNVYEVDGRYYLLDLPGYGYARVSRAQRATFLRLLDAILTDRPRLRGALWLLDIRHAPSDQDHAMQARLSTHGTPVLVVVTKADKLARGKRGQYVRTILDALDLEESQCVVTSAQTRDGVPDLHDAVTALVEKSV